MHRCDCATAKIEDGRTLFGTCLLPFRVGVMDIQTTAVFEAEAALEREKRGEAGETGGATGRDTKTPLTEVLNRPSALPAEPSSEYLKTCDNFPCAARVANTGKGGKAKKLAKQSGIQRGVAGQLEVCHRHFWLCRVLLFNAGCWLAFAGRSLQFHVSFIACGSAER